MTFDWMHAIAVVALYMLPCSIIGALLAFVKEHFVACTIFALMAVAAVFALAGMPVEVWNYD